jgi:hypothetical protein
MTTKYYSSLPDEALKRLCNEVNAAAEKLARERQEMGYACASFAQRLAQAVRRKASAFRAVTTTDDDEFEQRKERARRAGQNVDWNLQPSSRISASATANEQSFAEKLRKAVERKSPAKQQAEAAKRERARYRKPQRRPATKSD